MPVELTLVTAFIVGFVSSIHCVGMCGGIVGAFTLGVKGATTRPLRSLAPYLIAYNLGRITTYSCAGALLGFIGAQMLHATPSPKAQIVARLISGGFMVALGLYLAGWWTGLGALERLGAKLWIRIEPLGRRLLPVDHPGKAFVVGLIWGWLPCGLVYAALAWTLSSGSAAQGAALMIAFGIGTMPMLLALGASARWMGTAGRLAIMRRIAGVIVLSFGVYFLLFPHPPTAHFDQHTARQTSQGGIVAKSF